MTMFIHQDNPTQFVALRCKLTTRIFPPCFTPYGISKIGHCLNIPDNEQRAHRCPVSCSSSLGSYLTSKTCSTVRNSPSALADVFKRSPRPIPQSRALSRSDLVVFSA